MSISDIREGLAANLRTVMPNGQVLPYQISDPSPPSLWISGIDTLTRNDFAAGTSYTILVEGCFQLGTDVGPQIQLDDLIDLVGFAVESDGSNEGALFSRLSITGELLEDQPPACSSVALVEYRGATRAVLRNQIEVLLATWAIEAVT